MPRKEIFRWTMAIMVPVLALLVLSLVGCERKISGTVQTGNVVSDKCFECHNGTMDAMQGEWANSVHASGANVDYTSRDGSDCAKCHNQDGFIDWITNGTLAATYGNAKAIGCFACHNPHETGNFALRSMAAVTLLDGTTFDFEEGNLCANCHQVRRAGSQIGPNTDVNSTHWGPHHGPQGDLVAGAGGYEGFAGYTPENSIAHSMLDGSCTYCHMAYARTHEGYDVGGHSFNMEDEAGNNLTLVCRDCHGEIGSRGGEYTDITDSTDYDHDTVIEGFQVEVEGLMDSLRVLLIAEGVLSAGGSPVVQVIADGDLAGALFNYLIIEEDRSEGVHNPKYVISLLNASIAYVDGL